MRTYTVYDSNDHTPKFQGNPILQWWVLEDGKLYAGFKKETAADAYAMRMNKIQQRLHEKVTP